MSENVYWQGPDYSSLAGGAEAPKPTPENKPEKLDDDDDEVIEKESKPSILEVLRGEPEKPKEDKAEVEKPKEKAPDEKEMTEEEEPLAVAEIADERTEELESNPEPTAEDLAALAFVKSLKEEAEGGKTPQEAMDSAQQQALEVVGVEASEELPEEEPEPTPEPEAEPPVVSEVIDEPEEEPPVPVPPAAGGGSGRPPLPPVPPTPPGNNNLPPLPPIPGQPFPGGPLGGGPGGNLPPQAPNIAPNIAPNQPSAVDIERHGIRRGLLAGGIVGYLVGRRRGRIKTEKKLLPIQHKLEKEVSDLRDKIKWREEKVRTIVREKVVKEPAAAETIKERYARREAEKERIRARTLERRPTEPEASTERAPEILEHPEKLGKFAVLGENPAAAGAPEPETRPQAGLYPEQERLREERVEHGGPRPVEIMTLPELLLIAERIHIEQSSVKRLYETHRLSDEGLRRVIEAYLRGERYDRILNDNLLTPEQLKNPTLRPDLDMAGADMTAAGMASQSMLPVPPVNPSGQPTSGPMSLPPDTFLASKKKPMVPAGVIAVAVVMAVALIIFVLA